MKTLNTVKALATLAVTVGVGAIVGNLIKMTTPIDVKVLTKICIGIGGFALSGMASDLVGQYTEKKIDEAVDLFKEVIQQETAETQEA